MEVITANIHLSATALILRELRMQSGMEVEDISKISGIAVKDLLSFELDKKKPSKSQIRILEKIYTANQ